MKKNKTAKKLIKTVFNVIFYCIVLLMAVYMIFLLASNNKHKVNKIFNAGLVTILSPSMLASGYNVGDIVLIKSSKIKNVQVGNIIAFYNFDQGVSNTPLTYPKKENYMSNKTFGYNEKVINEQAKLKTNIWFHEIVDIRVGPNNMLWFKTKGSSNLLEDANWIREDYVIGTNATSAGLKNFLTFTFGPWGIVLFVEVPLGIIFIVLINVLLNEVDKILKSKTKKTFIKRNVILLKQKKLFILMFKLSGKYKFN